MAILLTSGTFREVFKAANMPTDRNLAIFYSIKKPN